MASTVDFRFLYEGLGGQKNKRKRCDEPDLVAKEGDGMDVERGWKRSAIAKEGEDRPTQGKSTYDGVMAGKISGRKWKEPKTARSSSLRVTGRKSTLEEKNKERQLKKAYLERKKELKEQIRSNKVEKRRVNEERKKRKTENQLRTGTVVQKISNPKTLKKMSKKQKKLLRQVPD